LANSVKSGLKKTGEFFKKIGKKKLVWLSVLAAIVLFAGIFGAILLNRVNYTVLYSGLSAEEAGKIKSELDTKGVNSKVKGTDTILVPEDQADDLRVELASEGYPDTGLNYDIFSNSSALGSTDLERQTYLQYQLQENMRTTICKFDKVKDCIVIVNLPNSSSFVLSSNTTDASVSVMVELDEGETLADTEAKSIGEFVEKCVPNLKPENISIVDSNMKYYNILSDDNSDSDATTDSNTQQELTERMKDILSKQVKSVLEPEVGTSNIAVSVNLSLNFDKETTSSDLFSPPVDGKDAGLVRSSQVQKDSSSSGSGSSGDAGTDSNGVSATQYVSGQSTATPAGSSSETYNYELNEVKTAIEKAQGTIKDLSVAVVINSNVKGVSDYQENFKNLIAKAIGVDPKQITVELIPFVQGSGNSSFDDYLAQSQGTLHEYNMNRLIRIGIIVGALVIVALAALFILGKRKKKKKLLKLNVTGSPEKAADNGEKPDEPAANKPMGKEVEDMLEKVVSKKTNETGAAEELVDKHPEAVVEILRNWLTEN